LGLPDEVRDDPRFQDNEGLLAHLIETRDLVAAGVVFLVKADSIRNSGAGGDNHALVDSAATGQVISQVSSGLTQVLSYDYRKPQVAQQATSQWLTGQAPQQYALLLNQLKEVSKGQDLVLVAKVISAGVISLQGDNASLLVFVDQQSTRESDQQSSVSGAQVMVSAVRHGDSWQISDLKPL
ncbi:MAG: hypothetical protein J0H43_08410, partial [Actinobacteria bacterium]|nr:hypothetical protein [Actinomycetota bacterium]